MEKNMDFSAFQNFQGFPTFDINQEQDPVFNPIMQYEQGYMYYRYLCKQMEYKIKCKEYEKLCISKSDSRNERRAE